MNFKNLLKDFNRTTTLFIRNVNNIPNYILSYRPFDDAWTVHEHIIHVADSELNAFLRLKTILAENGKSTFVIDEDKWVDNLFYNKESIEDYLILFKYIRKVEYNLLCKINSNIYDHNYVIHQNYGKVDIKTWIDWYTSKHIYMHLEYIKRNINIYEKEGNRTKKRPPSHNKA